MAVLDFQNEETLEKKLIETLVSSGYWTYEKDLDTEEKLWANLRSIINRNNMAALDGIPLTDLEFDQVKDKLSFGSFFKAALALRGEAGKFKIQIQREDASLGRVLLLILDNRDIAGGTSVYQIINQYRAPKLIGMDRDARFDVTLLINGLPMIHIELKNKAVSYMEAFNQIKTYVKEGKFKGIYSSCQMFVVTNGSETRYIAPANHDKLNAKFLSRWVDENNRPVENYLEFARTTLSIPEAHRLVSQYTVLDYDAESLILLRPYQIHAIRAVRKDIRDGNGGFVWHTTGSGKTLTSYKVAQNLLDIPIIDKTIFIVDRIDLDNQTTGAFSSYAKADFTDIDDTDDVKNLYQNLISPHRNMIITTIQKLNYLIKKVKSTDKSFSKLKELRLAFVVDECHRAVSSEKHREISKFFNKPLWYGFTGTPIFAENAKSAKGDLARTTFEQYGPCLHEYTVKDAILDKAVLGFQVEYKSTISDDDAYDIIMKHDPFVDSDSLTEIEKEDKIPIELYEKDGHMVQVINAIVNRSRLKFGLDKGPGNTFGAILTTSSIAKAQRYYELFKMLKDDELKIKISDRVKKDVPDFPKVAITYSIAPNQAESAADMDKMKVALEDYNNEYGTNFGLGEIRAYNANLNDRLARKKSLYKARNEQVDIVIVVDRLLTGFDAPSMALLFIDRPPMSSAGLIQAFSRTNRIYNRYKLFGQVVTFQKPATFEQAIEDAFRLYSNGGEAYIKAPTFEESLEKFEQALDNFNNITSKPEDLENLATLEERIEFVKAFQALDKSLAAIRVYGECDELNFNEKYGLDYDELEEYNGRYENIKEEIKTAIDDVDIYIDPEIDDFDGFDISYESMTVGKEDIGLDYLNSLIDNVHKKAKPKEKDFEDIFDVLGKLQKENPKLDKEIYRPIVEEIKNNPKAYEGIDIVDYINQEIYRRYEAGVLNISQNFKVPVDEVEYFMKIFDKNQGAKDRESFNYLFKKADLDTYKEEHDLSNMLKAKQHYRENMALKVAEDVAPYYVM